MKEKYLKIIVGLSVTALIVVSIFYFGKNNDLVFYSSITANIIQIVLFLAWYFQESPVPKETITQIEEIHQITKEREEKYKSKEKIISRLIEEGLISDYDVKKIFQSLKNKEIYLVHTYGEGVPQNLLKAYNGGTKPMISVLMKLGFVRVFGQHNLFIIFKKNLPRNLRKLKNLEEFLQEETDKIWLKIKEYSEKKYPSSKYKIYDKWRTGEGFKYSYVIFKSLEEEFVIGYKKRYSFTKEFVNSIIREMELSKIKPLIPDKVKLQQFVSKTSIEIFLEDKDIAEPIKKGILTHEKQLKDNLNIRVFTDFKDVPIDVLSEQIKNLLNSTEDMSNYARLIKIQAKEFFNVLKELGFSIKF